MAEWSIAAVLKTVEPRGSGGSNPSLSARQAIDDKTTDSESVVFCFCKPLVRNDCKCSSTDDVITSDYIGCNNKRAYMANVFVRSNPIMKGFVTFVGEYQDWLDALSCVQ